MQKYLQKIILLAALLVLTPGLRTNAQINAEQVVIIGRNVMSMEDYMLAIQYFNQAIKAKPYLPDPYFYRAIAKLSLEDYKGAQEDCTLAIERNKYKTESYKVRGFALQNLGQDSLAIIDYDRGLEYNPQDKYFLFYKAVAETELRRDSAANATFERLLRYYPGFEDGYTARGRLRMLEGDTVKAIEDLDHATKISPSLLQPYLVRAEIEASRKQWDKALEDMNEAIRLQPQEADFYVNRAFLRYNNDDYFGAMSDYNYTLELEPYNSAAMFNRALLRYEVKDLNRAATDFEGVLKLDPSNFHAIYNLGLVNLERGKNKEAIQSFGSILKKYPRFYPAYYALAEAYRNLGDMRTAMQNVRVADEMVRKYVKNPDLNKLDRPTIAAGKSNSAGRTPNEDESEEDVMNRFNQLVTAGNTTETQLSYNEKIKGRVQNRDIQVEPEPDYILSFSDSPESLQSVSNYFRELDDFNQRGYIPQRIYLAAGKAATDEKAINQLFSRVEYYNGLVKDGQARPADYLALGVTQTMLRNYDAAIEALDKAIGTDPRFTVAYMARANARLGHSQQLNATVSSDSDAEAEADTELRRRTALKEISDVIADYDRALQLNPRLLYAWFNKGNIYYNMHDYTSALQCYAEALRIDPSFGPAYFNRGITYLQNGNKRLAFVDLSKAGELGVLPSYNLLKRMK